MLGFYSFSMLSGRNAVDSEREREREREGERMCALARAIYSIG